MGLLNKIIGAVTGWSRRIKREVEARYEAAYQQWGQRSFIFGTRQDARFDADPSVRKELVRRHRQWTVNNGFVNRIRNLKIQFAVGVEGLTVVPNSSNEDWNESRQISWRQWCQKPEIGSSCTMGQLHRQWEGILFDDGEFFVVKQSRLDPSGQMIPAIQTIEEHRVYTPRHLASQEGKTIFDGIQLDGLGNPVGYWIRKAFDQTELDFFPAEDVIHVYKHRRPGLLRGLPEGYSVMNDLHDMDDWQLLEMQASKAAARITNVVTNASGTANPKTLRRSMLNIQTNNADGQAVTKNTSEYYNVTLGGDTVVLRKGDDVKQFKSDRPSVVTQQAWDNVLSKICCGYNVPKLLVTPYSLQGTVTRADLDICTNAFREDFEIIRWVVEQIYQWQTKWSVEFDRAMDGKPPADYLENVIRPPRAPNVDVGKNQQPLRI